MLLMLHKETCLLICEQLTKGRSENQKFEMIILDLLLFPIHTQVFNFYVLICDILVVFDMSGSKYRVYKSQTTVLTLLNHTFLRNTWFDCSSMMKVVDIFHLILIRNRE